VENSPPIDRVVSYNLVPSFVALMRRCDALLLRVRRAPAARLRLCC
jgi:hypothetical protein